MDTDTPGEERPDSLAAAIPDVVLALETDGTVASATPALARVLGYDPDAVVGDDALSYVPEADRESVREAARRVVDDREHVERVDHRCRTADGGTVWLESAITADGDSLVVSAREVTDRKRAERRHREETERLRQIAANAGDVLFTFDAEFSELQFANEPYETVWGQSLTDLAADPTDLIEGAHPNDREPLLDCIDALVAGEEIDTEFRVNPAENYSRWVRLQGTPIEDDGEVVRLVAVAHDVTKRRERERQVRAMDSVLRHNLRNDLNVVIGHAEQLGARPDLDRETATHLRRIIEHCESLLSTADKGRHIVDLLGPEEATARVDVADVVREAAAAAADANPWASVAVDVPESAVATCAPKAPLAVTELLDNALTHTEGVSATVEVTVERDDDRVVLTVADDGPPIPAVDRGAVVGERDVTQIDHGSGLGLWLVAWVARCSDGSVAFDTEQSGNEVRIRFPAPE